jgi:N-acetylneuraminate lyase
MTSKNWFTGLVPAVFTPMHADGSLNLTQVKPIVEHLVRDRVGALFVCGSTGEGVSLSSEERRAAAAAYVTAAAGQVPVIVHVGHSSLTEARELAAHAQRIGANAIAAIPPAYFKPDSLETLVLCMEQITAAAPALPFYYYHIPRRTGVDLDMAEFLRLGSERIPTLAGIKYGASAVDKFQACVDLGKDRFNMLFGVDEMLLSGLVVGAHGAVGSTYNFAAPLYQHIIVAHQKGEMEKAKHYQGLAVRMVSSILKYGVQPGVKAMMKLIGIDCGPNRLPLRALTREQIAALHKDMEAVGFFGWVQSGFSEPSLR